MVSFFVEINGKKKNNIRDVEHDNRLVVVDLRLKNNAGRLLVHMD